MSRARGSSSEPAAVRATVLGVRTNSTAPSLSSSRRTVCDSEGGAMPSMRAALVKWSSSATATNARNSAIVGATGTGSPLTDTRALLGWSEASPRR